MTPPFFSLWSSSTLAHIWGLPGKNHQKNLRSAKFRSVLMKNCNINSSKDSNVILI